MFAAACRLFCHCPQNVGKGDRSVLQFSNTLGLQWGKEKNVWVRFEPYPEYLNHSTKPTAQTHRFQVRPQISKQLCGGKRVSMFMQRCIERKMQWRSIHNLPADQPCPSSLLTCKEFEAKSYSIDLTYSILTSRLVLMEVPVYRIQRGLDEVTHQIHLCELTDQNTQKRHLQKENQLTIFHHYRILSSSANRVFR